MIEDAENHINSAMGKGEGAVRGRSLPSANPDNVAAGCATDARCGGEGERRGGDGYSLLGSKK